MKVSYASEKNIRPLSQQFTHRKSALSQVLHAEDKTNLFQGLFRGKSVSMELKQYEPVTQQNFNPPESIQILLRKH